MYEIIRKWQKDQEEDLKKKNATVTVFLLAVFSIVTKKMSEKFITLKDGELFCMVCSKDKCKHIRKLIKKFSD